MKIFAGMNFVTAIVTSLCVIYLVGEKSYIFATVFGIISVANFVMFLACVVIDCTDKILKEIKTKS